MTMRMTEKQKQLADRVGKDAFWAIPSLEFTPEWKRKEFTNHPIDWEAWFKRTDITPEQKTELTVICNAAYEREYNSFLSTLMTPQTEAEWKHNELEETAYSSFIDTALQAWK